MMTTPQQPPRRPRSSKGFSRGERLIVSSPLIVLVLLNAWYFLYATDDPVDRNEELAAFYGMAYEENAATAAAYAQATRRAREAVNLKNRVETFIRDYDLQDRKVLDVGSGDGYLQDLVADYTGLDIAKTAARYYHKPFVHGTATAMPFEHNTFDAIWTIWVLEHIPNPEAALAEMRRVVKPGGLLYLHPAWNCVPWAANGYEVTPLLRLRTGRQDHQSQCADGPPSGIRDHHDGAESHGAGAGLAARAVAAALSTTGTELRAGPGRTTATPLRASTPPKRPCGIKLAATRARPARAVGAGCSPPTSRSSSV